MSSVLKIGQMCLTAEETHDLLAPGPRAKTAPRPRSLRSNFSWTFAGNVVYAGCQWGMLIVLAKLGSPEKVGQFALGLAVTAPIIMLTNLHLRAIQATDARREYRFGHYLALRLATTALALLVIAGIALLGRFRGETALVILAIGAAKSFEAISDVLYGLFQQHERMELIAGSMMIKGPLSLAALMVAVYFTRNVLWGPVALAVAWAILLAVYDLPNGIRILRGRSDWPLWPEWHARRLATLFVLALPMGCVTMLISFNSNISRYFLDYDLGEKEVGIFSALAFLMIAGAMIVNALGQAASPRLSRYYSEGDIVAFRGLMLRLYALSTLLGVVGVLVSLLAGRRVLTLLYGPEYAGYTDVLTYLMVASSLMYIFGIQGTGLTAQRRFRVQALLHASFTILALFLSSLFIAKYGIRGASYAILAQTAIMVIAYARAGTSSTRIVLSPLEVEGRSGEA